MSKYLNEQKQMQDGVNYYDLSEVDFKSKAEKAARETHDSTIAFPLIDSSTAYYFRSRDAKKKLKAINFSIDSLSKMK